MFEMLGLGTSRTGGTKVKNKTNKTHKTHKPHKIRKSEDRHVKSQHKTDHKTHSKSNTHSPTIDTSKPVIGKVYANWCGHCKTLMPIWAEMKDDINNNFPDKYTFSEIESEQQIPKFEKIKEDYNIDLNANGYPTLFKIQNGNVEYYNGAREKEAMKSWFIIVNGGSKQGGKNKKKKSRHNKTVKR